MSTEETETPETPTEEVTEEASEMTILETKILRFAKLRDVLLMKDKDWVDEHNQTRKDLLEEAGLLEKFMELDKELQEHRVQLKANVEPINACVQVLAKYRQSKVDGVEFEGMETLEKVWVFEEQIFKGVEKTAEKEEKEEENSEE